MATTRDERDGAGDSVAADAAGAAPGPGAGVDATSGAGASGAAAAGATGDPGAGAAGGTGPPVAGEPAADLAADLDALEEIVGRLATSDIAMDRLTYSGPWLGEAAVRIHRAVQRLTGKRLQWLLAEDADGRWALGGARTYAQHVAHTHRIGQSRAKAEVRLARQLRDEAPAFEQAVRRDEIGLEQAEILARGALTSADRIAGLHEPVHHDDAQPGAPIEQDDGPVAEGDEADPDAGDDRCAGTIQELLLRHARRLRPEEFRRLVRHYAAVADPEADDRGYRKAQEKEHLELSRTLDGFHLRGFLTEEHGQQVRIALDSLMGAPIRQDTRSATQRRAQALADMARVVLDQGLAGTAASVRPHLGVLIGPTDFARIVADHGGDCPEAPTEHTVAAGAPQNWPELLSRPPAMWADASGPVPAQVVRRLARCADVYRVLFSPDSEIINHGRAHRVFTAAQRRAIIARDRHCTFPGCTAPPALCETHHAKIRWRDNGATDVHNGALLCFYHHDLVESRGLLMARAGGRWRFHHRDGTEVHTAYDARTADRTRHTRSGSRIPRDSGRR